MDHVFQREDNAARWHQNNGVTRVNTVLRDTQFLSHSRISGSWECNIPLRQMMVDLYQAANPAPEGRTCQEMGRQAEEAWVGGKTARGKESDETPIPLRMPPGGRHHDDNDDSPRLKKQQSTDDGVPF
jgi:hypothetical protein